MSRTTLPSPTTVRGRTTQLAATSVRCRSTLRPVLAALTVAAALMVALVAPAGSASAATYRYWGYYQLQNGAWAFATKGPDQTTPADGAVEGWRFAIGTEGSTRLPRVTTTFDEVCGPTKAVSGKKRVAVVIDYGRPADTEDGSAPPAPVARCGSVDTAATGAEVLAAVATVRAQGGLVCGIDGEPATGCGGEVKDVSAAAKAPDTPVTLARSATATQAAAAAAAADRSSSGPSPWTYAGIALVVLIAAALVVTAVRRRGEH
jgi:hypothetical protein